MMNALIGIGYVSLCLHGIFIDSTWFKIYTVLFLCYLGFVIKNRDMRDNPKRKTLNIATWGGKFTSRFYDCIRRAHRSHFVHHRRY
jgi:hypothetical protein